MIQRTTGWGDMVDFLRANPFVSKEEYLWQWTVPQVELAAMDFTHTIYLSEEQAKRADKGTVYEDPDDFARDMGIITVGDAD